MDAIDKPRTPGVPIPRVCGALNQLLATGIARRVEDDLLELVLDPEEAAQGGMVTISMYVRIRREEAAELYSAWLAVPPGIADGTILVPTVMLRGMERPVRFRMRVLDGE